MKKIYMSKQNIMFVGCVIIEIFLIIFQLIGISYMWQPDNIIFTDIVFIVIISLFIFFLLHIKQKNFVIFSVFICIILSNLFLYEDYISAVFLLCMLIYVYKKLNIKKKYIKIIARIAIILTIISFVFYTLAILLSFIFPSNIYTFNRQLTVIEHKNGDKTEYYDVCLYRIDNSTIDYMYQDMSQLYPSDVIKISPLGTFYVFYKIKT
ncbi:MAG: hypothetical protein FWD71_23465, partial [Oscillospiraceae bacterium]|nr:hypothetical protein [Oscillospiraceae bacterium]